MAFDGVAISCILHELNKKCINGRVDKIVQPERDEINIVIRAGGENLRLLASASSSNPRVHLTKFSKENPEKAPLFCMLLRKHIGSGKIVGFTQPDFERVLEIHIESRNELGDLSVKRLIIEIMGRHSNIILADCDGRILGSAKQIDFTVSAVRQILPGMLYEPPPTQGKLNPMTTEEDVIFALAANFDGPGDKFILNTFTGIGPLSAREMVHLATGSFDTDIGSMTKLQAAEFSENVVKSLAAIKNGDYEPVLLYKNKQNIMDFSAINVTHYGDNVIVQRRPELNSALDEFYHMRDRQERMSQKTADLSRFIDNNIKRCQKKLTLQHQKLSDCENKDKDKEFGDLLIANLHTIEEKLSTVEVENYYDDMKLITIKLKPELTPSQNAQRYYSLYQKAKNAEVMTTEQLRLTNDELNYLESVQESLSNATSVKDISEIREELLSQGYGVRRNKPSKIRKATPSEMMKFLLSDGFELLIGKNNTQNDELTLRLSKPNDLWFHTKNIPGSHAVISTGGRQPSDDVIVEAAKLCAYYSKAKNSANVPVDYTIIKNVKKPNNAKPGMVIYENYNTVNVKPERID